MAQGARIRVREDKSVRVRVREEKISDKCSNGNTRAKLATGCKVPVMVR